MKATFSESAFYDDFSCVLALPEKFRIWVIFGLKLEKFKMFITTTFKRKKH